MEERSNGVTLIYKGQSMLTQFPTDEDFLFVQFFNQKVKDHQDATAKTQ